jgi:hypothetical protein
VVDDHVIAGPLDKCLERLHELAAVGLTEVAPGVLNGEVEQVRMVGREVIPLLHQIEVTPWHEVASARV